MSTGVPAQCRLRSEKEKAHCLPAGSTATPPMLHRLNARPKSGRLPAAPLPNSVAWATTTASKRDLVALLQRTGTDQVRSVYTYILRAKASSTGALPFPPFPLLLSTVRAQQLAELGITRWPAVGKKKVKKLKRASLRTAAVVALTADDDVGDGPSLLELTRAKSSGSLVQLLIQGEEVATTPRAPRSAKHAAGSRSTGPPIPLRLEHATAAASIACDTPLLEAAPQVPLADKLPSPSGSQPSSTEDVTVVIPPPSDALQDALWSLPRPPPAPPSGEQPPEASASKQRRPSLIKSPPKPPPTKPASPLDGAGDGLGDEPDHLLAVSAQEAPLQPPSPRPPPTPPAAVVKGLRLSVLVSPQQVHAASDHPLAISAQDAPLQQAGDPHLINEAVTVTEAENATAAADGIDTPYCNSTPNTPPQLTARRASPEGHHNADTVQRFGRQLRILSAFKRERAAEAEMKTSENARTRAPRRVVSPLVSPRTASQNQRVREKSLVSDVKEANAIANEARKSLRDAERRRQQAGMKLRRRVSMHRLSQERRSASLTFVARSTDDDDNVDTASDSTQKNAVAPLPQDSRIIGDVDAAEPALSERESNHDFINGLELFEETFNDSTCSDNDDAATQESGSDSSGASWRIGGASTGSEADEKSVRSAGELRVAQLAALEVIATRMRQRAALAAQATTQERGTPTTSPLTGRDDRRRAVLQPYRGTRCSPSEEEYEDGEVAAENEKEEGEVILFGTEEPPEPNRRESWLPPLPTRRNVETSSQAAVVLPNESLSLLLAVAAETQLPLAEESRDQLLTEEEETFMLITEEVENDDDDDTEEGLTASFLAQQEEFLQRSLRLLRGTALIGNSSPNGEGANESERGEEEDQGGGDEIILHSSPTSPSTSCDTSASVATLHLSPAKGAPASLSTALHAPTSVSTPQLSPAKLYAQHSARRKGIRSIIESPPAAQQKIRFGNDAHLDLDLTLATPLSLEGSPRENDETDAALESKAYWENLRGDELPLCVDSEEKAEEQRVRACEADSESERAQRLGEEEEEEQAEEQRRRAREADAESERLRIAKEEMEEKKTRRLVTAVASHSVLRVKLALDDGASPNASENSERPRGSGWPDSTPVLFMALCEETLAIATLLLERGASTEARDPIGKTALHLCAECNRHEALELLLAHGALREAVDDEGSTPLVYAASQGHVEATMVLIAHEGVGALKIDEIIDQAGRVAAKTTKLRI